MHVELLFELTPGSDPAGVETILRGHGLDPLPMKAGFLVSAELDAVQKLLPGVRGTEAGDLPAPAALANSVRSIRFFKPRSLHSPTASKELPP